MRSSLRRSRTLGDEGPIELWVAEVRSPDLTAAIGTQSIEVDVTDDDSG